MAKFDRRNEAEAAKSVSSELLESMDAPALPTKAAKRRETKSAHVQLLMRPATKAAAFEAAADAGVSLNEWMNNLVETQLEREGRLQ